MAEATPELFMDSVCGRALPAGEVLQDFKFGQFSRVVNLDGTGGTVFVGKKKMAPKGGGGLVGPSADQEVTVLVDLLRRASGGNGKRPVMNAPVSLSAAPPAVALDPAEVAAVIATRTLEEPYGSRNVDFTSHDVARLLEGRAVDVQTFVNGEPQAIRFAPTARLLQPDTAASLDDIDPTLDDIDPTDGDGPVPDPPARIHLVFGIMEPDLAAFLNKPEMRTKSGVLIKLPLDPKHVLELSQNRRETLVEGIQGSDNNWYTIFIKVHPKAIDVPDGGSSPDKPDDKKSVDVPAETYDPQPPIPGGEVHGVMLALYFEWQQTWTLTGFSRGRLLQSLALAPQEDTTIELFTWDRQTKTLESSSTTETEQSMENEEKTQDTTEVMRELTKKDEFELKAGASLDVQYNGPSVTVHAEANVDIVDKTNVDDVCKTTTKAIREGVQKSSSKLKTQRTSKVTETTETGSETRVTRTIRNPNMCHTLNLDYFEILTHYKVQTTFNENGMRFCATIPNPIVEKAFEPLFIRAHEGALRDALLDRSLAPGFEAVRFLAARQTASDELARRRDERKPKFAAPPGGGSTVTPDVSAEEDAADNYLLTLRSAARALMHDSAKQQLKNALGAIGGHNPPSPADLAGGKTWLAQQLLQRSFSQLAAELSQLASSAEQPPPRIREWGPRLATVMPDATSVPRPSKLKDEPQEVREGLLSPVLWTGQASDSFVLGVADWGWWWGELRRVGLLNAEDAGVGPLAEQFQKVYREFLAAVKRDADEDTGDKAFKKAQEDQEAINEGDRLENDFPLRDYALASERAEVLRLHLREHADHYSFALFRALHPQEQLNYIEKAMATITTGLDPGFYQPRVVSQIGSLLIIPLNHNVVEEAAWMLDQLKDRIDVADVEDTVVLPAPGLSIESRLGHCSACEEFIEESRVLDLAQRAAEVRQAVAEADRLEKRLAQATPLLSDPNAAVPHVSVDMAGPAPR